MCVIVWRWTPDEELVLSMWANRDEWLSRPSLPLAPWFDNPALVGGRDLQAGGAWLLFNQTEATLAALTNIRESKPEGDSQAIRPSRGLLTVQALQDGSQNANPASFSDFAGFHLIRFAARLKTASWITHDEAQSGPISTGFGSVSNGPRKAQWPKQLVLLQAMQNAKDFSAKAWCQAGWEALSDRRAPNIQDLPDTGLGLARETELGSVFVNTATYGTRQSTILRLWAHGAAQIWERTWVGHAATLTYSERFWSNAQST